jgi:hypothetical protein
MKTTKINKKRITTIIMGHEVSWRLAFDKQEEKKRIVPMGNTLTKHSTMTDRELKVLWGSRGRFFKRAPWPPEAQGE